MECPRRASFWLWRTPSAVTPPESSTHVSQHNMKDVFMKKVKSTSDQLRAEYSRSDFGKLERGKYDKRVKTSSNVVILDAEVAAVFPNSAAVNKALHSLVDVAQKASGLTRCSTPVPPKCGLSTPQPFLIEGAMTASDGPGSVMVNERMSDGTVSSNRVDLLKTD